MKTKDKKVIFLDVDGTLVGFDGKIPASAEAAIKGAQQLGHRVFVCTGRCKGVVYDILLDFGFDGFVTSTGALIEYHDKVIFKDTITKEQFNRVLQNLDYKKSPITVNRHCGTLLRKKDVPHIMSAWDRGITDESKKSKGGHNSEALFESIQPCFYDDDVENYPNKYDDISAINYVDAEIPVDEMQKKIGNELNVTIASFGKLDPYCAEITIAAHDKATSIDKVCEYLGVPLENTIAIGDSANDECMIRHAHIGIAMGNAADEIKQAANFITNPVNKNGIAKAFIELGLLD